MEKLIRRIICFALTASLVSGCATVEKVTDTAKDARSKVADTAKNAGKTVYDWATNIDTDAFKAGWNAAVDFVEDQNAVAMSSEYVDSVATAINNLKKIPFCTVLVNLRLEPLSHAVLRNSNLDILAFLGYIVSSPAVL